MNENVERVVESYLNQLKEKQTFRFFDYQQLHNALKLNILFLLLQLDKKNPIKHEQLIEILEKDTIMETTYYMEIVETMSTFYQLMNKQKILGFHLEYTKEYPFTFKYWELNEPYLDCVLKAKRPFKAIELSNDHQYISSDKEVPGAMGIEMKCQFKTLTHYVECRIRTLMIHSHWEIFSFHVKEEQYEEA